ncbi:hypothetical protein ACFQV2_34215 [Actinokineospora soli]|uniref:Ig-like domain (Group 3) n=1 Tax=Actinokineospora soli TaxID=1048753 RepID=A0ABW2TV19_9PSEU
MEISGRPRRALGGFLAALMAGAGLVALAPQAAAATSGTDVAPSSWVQTDSRTPHAAMTSGTRARIGAWRDDQGQHHIGKTYFTFDISRVADVTVFKATLWLKEAAANDCSVARATEVWSARPEGPIAWATQPAELTRLDYSQRYLPCVAGSIRVDTSDEVRAALAAGRKTLTIAVRISEEHQGDAAYGRALSTSPVLSVEHNSPPSTPTNLRYSLRDLTCGDARPIARGDVTVEASLTDPDGELGLTARMALWPVDDPATRHEVVASVHNGTATATFPVDLLRHDATFAWAVRGEDGHVAGEWSQPCTFHTDYIAPAKPGVASQVYPENPPHPGSGGVGVPGEFTFTAGGSTDVVAYVYGSTHLNQRVQADGPGNSATITLTPTTNGPTDLIVRSVDAAGNQSEQVLYRYWVRSSDTHPWVTAEPAMIGETFPVRFHSNQPGAVTFTYRFAGGPDTTVDVGPDGTTEVLLRVTDPSLPYASLELWTTAADGTTSGVRTTYVDVLLGEPYITITPNYAPIGSNHTILLEPGMPGVVSYTYTVDGGEPVEVAADADGRAQTTFRSTTPGSHEIAVFSTTADGVQSGTWWETFVTDGMAPDVTSAEYPRSGSGSGPGTFRFESRLTGTTEFRYTLNGVEGTVPAVDGVGTLAFTPTAPGAHTLWVRAVTGDGLVSGQTYHPFTVTG